MAEDAGVKWVITEAAHAERAGVPRTQRRFGWTMTRP